MRKDRPGTVVLQARAALKQALGLVTGERVLQAEGAAERVAARARDGTGPIKSGRHPKAHVGHHRKGASICGNA